MSSLDYLDLCRLCLVKDGVSVPIFEGEGDVRQIFLKIAACLPVKVAREDKLPKKICDNCVYKVELLYQFWNTTANAEKQLLQWLGEVGLEDKQGYVTGVLNTSTMKEEDDASSVIQSSIATTTPQSGIGIGVIDNIGLGMPFSGTTHQQQLPPTIPINQPIHQALPGPSNQPAPDQLSQTQGNATTRPQDEEEESSEEEDNSDDDCDADDGLPVKEESEEDLGNSRNIEPTTFVNVSLACDEAGPSGLQQQKNTTEIPELSMPQTLNESDAKSGAPPSDPLSIPLDESRILSDEKVVKVEYPLDSMIWPKEGDEDVEVKNEMTVSDSECNSVAKAAIQPRRIESSKKSSSISRTFECNSCQRTFSKKSNLAEHLKQHRHKCTECGKTFSMKRYLDGHFDKIHKFQLYKCNLCDYKSNNKGTLKNHFIRLHTNEFNFSCDTCGKQFKIKKALNHHMKQDHSGNPPIVCDICGNFSKNIHALKAHIKYRHHKPAFECHICKRGMTTQENLRQHLSWHENIEKVVCPTCGKKFRGRDLDSHMRVHTGVKPFSCPVCGKSFRRQTAQEQHILIHTGKRPYVCDVCGQAFAQKPGLTCHRKRHPGPLPPLPAVSIKTIVTQFKMEYAGKRHTDDEST
ncbi:zinc finger protein 391-like isoform X10 [Athalia rosae]|uniref:zinc finger protein 391-like isoform X10 n=1 Tax=Athalia rosae TaxID=37344 RepID=UPI0020340111|nr:zinc finger protein 391-like isoform X10 [Athalia rosae]